MARRATVLSPTNNILERSLARREGRRFGPDKEEIEKEPVERQPDLLREAIERGDVTFADIPLAEKHHDVLQTAVEQAWKDAGPSDLDALRCREQGHRFIDPATVKAMERGQPRDISFEQAANEMEANVRRAARADYDRIVENLLERGHSLQVAQAEAATAVRTHRASRLPSPSDDLMSAAASDERISPGQPVRREVPEHAGDSAPAQVVRDVTPERLRQLDGGVTRAAPAPG